MLSLHTRSTLMFLLDISAVRSAVLSHPLFAGEPMHQRGIETQTNAAWAAATNTRPLQARVVRGEAHDRARRRTSASSVSPTPGAGSPPGTNARLSEEGSSRRSRKAVQILSPSLWPARFDVPRGHTGPQVHGVSRRMCSRKRACSFVRLSAWPHFKQLVSDTPVRT